MISMNEATKLACFRSQEGTVKDGNRIEYQGRIDDDGFVRPDTSGPLIYRPRGVANGKQARVVVHPAIAGNPYELVFEGGEEIKFLPVYDEVDLEGLTYVFRVYIK